MASKEKAIQDLIDIEGGEVNDPDDLGKLTKFGISARMYPTLDIHNLTREQATEIYSRDYWEAFNLGSLPPVLGTLVLHYGAVAGPATAIILLQRALGVKADGILGIKTVTAAINALSKYPNDTIAKVVAVQITYMKELVQKRPVQIKFWDGWMARIVKSVISSVEA